MTLLWFGFEEWTFPVDALHGPTGAEDADTEQAAALRELLTRSVTELPQTGWRELHSSQIAATFAVGDVETGWTVAWLEWFQESFMREGRDRHSTRDADGRWLPRGTYDNTTRFGVAPPDGTSRCFWWLRTTPQPEDREIAVDATDPHCASGRATGARLRPPVVELTDDEVLIAFCATRLAGGQTCPSHPPTPATVTLDGPIGDRTILDGGWWPFRPPTAPGNR
jgi:hypothetical protein